MKTVLVFGTFDVIHPGHVYFLEQARARGDRLVASVARDSFVRMFKRREPVHDEHTRLESILETGLVDEARLSDEVQGTYSIVGDLHPDLVCMGHDQGALEANLRSWAANNDQTICVETLAALEPERYKSSILNTAKGKD